jgi:tape measure domain-containing protein
MSDVARLVLEIDSSQVGMGDAALQRFNNTARATAQQASMMKNATIQFASSLGGIIVPTSTAAKQMADLNVGLGNFGNRAGGAGRAAAGAGKDFTDMFRSLLNAREGTEGLIGGFLRLGTGAYLVGRALQTTVGIVTGAIRPFIEHAAAMESMQASYGALLGSTTQGSSMVGFLQSLSTQIPISMNAMSNGTKTLLGFGFTMNEVKDAMPKLAQVAQGNSAAFDHLAVVYGQVRAQGKMYMNDLRQFTNAGVPMIEALSQIVRAPQSEIGNMIKNGQIGLDAVSQALTLLTAEGGRFHDTLTAAADTLNGQLTIAANNFKLLFADVGAGPTSWLKDQLANVNMGMAISRVKAQANAAMGLTSGEAQLGGAIGAIANPTAVQLGQAKTAYEAATSMYNQLVNSKDWRDKVSADSVYSYAQALTRRFPTLLAGTYGSLTEKSQLLAPRPDREFSNAALSQQEMIFEALKLEKNQPGAKAKDFNFDREATNATIALVKGLTNLNPALLTSGEPYYDLPGQQSITIQELYKRLEELIGSKGPKTKGAQDRFGDAQDAFWAALMARKKEYEQEETAKPIGTADVGDYLKDVTGITNNLRKAVYSIIEDLHLDPADAKSLLRQTENIIQHPIPTYIRGPGGSAVRMGGALSGVSDPYAEAAKPKDITLGTGTGRASTAYEAQLLSIKDMESALTAMDNLKEKVIELKLQLYFARIGGKDFATAMMAVLTSLENGAKSAYVDAFKSLGSALANGSNGAKAMGDSLRASAIEAMNRLPALLLEAGLKACLNGNWVLGLALIAASGLVAVGAGMLNENGNDTGSSTAKQQLDDMYRYYMAAEAFNRSGYKQAALSGFADGTDFAPGGWAMVGERGPEPMYVPRGSTIVPHEKMARYASGVGGVSNQVNVIVNNNATGTTATAEDTVDAQGQRTVQITVERIVTEMATKGKLNTPLAIGSSGRRIAG